MMVELTYFLGLQIKQEDKGISIFQEQYTRNLLKKYEIFDSPSVKTPMVPPNNLGHDLAGKPVNETSYRGMIGSLMYLTATRPDIQFSIVLCFDLKGYSNSDYVVAIWTKKAPQVLGGNYSSTEQVNFIQQLLAYSLITRAEVNIREIICSDYPQDEKFGFLPAILSNSNFTKDPSKVTDIELTTHMIALNNQKDSVSPPPLALRLQEHSLRRDKSLNTVPDPQDLERNIQLASTGLPSTLDEGTRKSQPLPESTATPPKDSGGNVQPFDKDLTSTTYDEGTAKTMPRPEGSLGDKDSGGNKPPADMEPINHTIADL
ncbi:hypothetical protein Tco_0105282 [Tanacetum coccineum]